MNPWSLLHTPIKVDFLTSDNQLRYSGTIYGTGNSYTLEDRMADVEEGDRVAIPLPNGKMNNKIVKSVEWHDGISGAIAGSWELELCSVEKYHSTYEKRSPQNSSHITINNSNGVTIGNLTQFQGNLTQSDVFSNVKNAVTNSDIENDLKNSILTLLDDLSAAKNKDEANSKFVKFVGGASQVLATLSPYIPAITDAIQKF